MLNNKNKKSTKQVENAPEINIVFSFYHNTFLDSKSLCDNTFILFSLNGVKLIVQDTPRKRQKYKNHNDLKQVLGIYNSKHT